MRVLDSLDDFYDPALKRRNLDAMGEKGGDRFEMAAIPRAVDLGRDFTGPQGSAESLDEIDQDEVLLLVPTEQVQGLAAVVGTDPAGTQPPVPNAFPDLCGSHERGSA